MGHFKKPGLWVAIPAVIITLLLCLNFTAFADEDDEAEAVSIEMYGIVTADVLNVRSEPNTSCQVLGQLVNGSYVKINSTKPGWAEIAFRDGAAFVSTDYVMIRTGDMPSRASVISETGEKVVEYAKSFLGTPYRYGGMSPSGFDCSGFVKYVYAHFGYNLNRTAASQMSNGYVVESKAELRPGDVVLFYQRGTSGYIGHAGIYVGGGQMIHSPQTGESIKFAPIDSGGYNTRYAGGRRIIID